MTGCVLDWSIQERSEKESWNISVGLEILVSFDNFFCQVAGTSNGHNSTSKIDENESLFVKKNLLHFCTSTCWMYVIIWKVLDKFDWFNHTESHQKDKKSLAAFAHKIRMYPTSAVAVNFIAIQLHFVTSSAHCLNLLPKINSNIFLYL